MQIDNILGKLDPKTRERVMSATAARTVKVPTPSIGLTSSLRGGFGIGRQVLLWGNK